MTLTNKNGISVTLVEGGGAIQSIRIPDRSGAFADIELGYDDPAAYPGYSTFGAFCGRYANRLAGAQFTLNGETFHVTKNEGENCLHGGRGFHLRTWKLEKTETGARLSLESPDGDEGFPGDLKAWVDVTLTDDDALVLDYGAVCDKDTVINLTNHSYFNLSGADTVLAEELRIDADAYLEVGPGLIPTGRKIDVTGTEFDFRTRRPIKNGWYDHCFVLNGGSGAQMEAYDPVSGRGMRIETDQPGVQLYLAGGIRNVAGKGGKTYNPNSGFCLETQAFPDAPNHPDFPSAVLKAGETWHSRTVFRFFAE